MRTFKSFKKPTKYRTVFYRAENSTDKTELEQPISIFGNPALWAYSTLPPSVGNDSLIKIYEHKDTRDTTRNRIWLHDILDDNKIGYKVEIIGAWASRRKFGERQYIYVEEKNFKKARRLIRAYKNAEGVFDEENMVDDIKNGLPQVTCPSCGKEFDFDYNKCPYCKTKLDRG